MKFKSGYTIDQGITQGMLMDFMSCRVKVKKRLNGWKKKGPESRSLRFGTLVHSLLECYHVLLEKSDPQSHKPGKIRGAWKGALRAYWQRTAEAHTKRYLKIAGDAATSEEIELEKVKALILLDAYVNQWHESERKVRFVDVEPTFDVRFHGYRLRGRKDGLFKKRNKLWLLESKTMSVVREAELNERLSYDFQLQFYLTALRITTGGKRGDSGALFNILHTPVLKLGKAESFDHYRNRVTEDIQKRPEFYYRRYEVIFPEKVLAVFEEDLLNILREFERWTGDGLSTFKNQSACFSFWPCPFIASCASDTMLGYERGDDVFPELKEDSYASSH